MAIIVAVLLFGSAIFILGNSEADIVDHSVDGSRAFYIAEGGLERARTWVGNLYLDDPTADPVGMRFEDQALGGGTYTAEVLGEAGGGFLEAYDIVSTGEYDGVLRQVKATVISATFAIYQWYIENPGGGDSWFRTGERFEGPIHLNCNIKVDGDPWFGGPVRAAGQLIQTVGSNPTFVMGYEEFVPMIPLPTRESIMATIRTQAMESDGIYGGPLGVPPQFYYDVILGNPADGWLSYAGYANDGTLVADTVYVDIASTNGTAWFDERIKIHGTLDGMLTIGVDSDVYIVDDILYEGSTPGPGGGLDDDCDDMLGLLACGHPWGDIVLADTPENWSDLEVHGVMMSLQQNIAVENLTGSGGPRGTFRIHGGMLSDLGFQLAVYSGGVLTSGYVREYNYDYRVLTMPPPFFPLTGEFEVVTWEEVVPPVVS
jgi:hypothetical protein